MKRLLTWKEIGQTDGNTVLKVFTFDEEKKKSAWEKAKGIFDESFRKFKDYFKIKVWSEIPYAIGMNDGAAIAAAVALVLNIELAKDKVNAEKLISNFQNLREAHPEEVILDDDFMSIFTTALALNFYSNGAAVFASLLGCTNEQEVIDYECLFYHDFRNFFKPYPKFKNAKEAINFKDKHSIFKYFTKCFTLSRNLFMGVPLFKWSFSKLTFKNRDELALLIVGRDFVHSGEENLGIPPNSGFKHYCISPANFVILAEPTTIVLCEASPHRHIFGEEELLLSFKTLYSSRKQEWGAKGAEVIKPKEEPEPQKEKLEYARIWYENSKPEGEPIDEQRFNELIKDRQNYKIFIIDRGEYEMGSIGEVYLDNQPILKQEDSDEKKVKKKKVKDYLTPYGYKLLVYTLKNRYRAGNIITLVEKCWGYNTKTLRDELKKDRDAFMRLTSTYRKTIANLSKFLYAKIGVRLRSHRTGSYSLTGKPKFCLIEII